jgi:hypothetical protein
MRFSPLIKGTTMQFIRRLLPLTLGLLAACGGQPPSSAPAQLPNQLHATVLATDYTTVVQQLYIAYFGRPADTGGLANFQQRMANLNAPTTIAQLDAAYRTNAALRELVDSFSTSGESKALYGSGDTTAFITAVYRNILNRAPDAEGLAYWAAEIDKHGLSRANASLSIMAGALSNASSQGLLDAALVGNKVSVSIRFIDAITQASSNGYAGDAAAAQARTMLTNVSASTNLTSYQSTINQLVSTLSSTSSGGTSSSASLDFRPKLLGMLAGTYLGRCGGTTVSATGEVSVNGSSFNMAAANAYFSLARDMTGTFASTSHMNPDGSLIGTNLVWDFNNAFIGFGTSTNKCDTSHSLAGTSLPTMIDIGAKIASLIKDTPGGFDAGICTSIQNGAVSKNTERAPATVTGNVVSINGFTVNLGAARTLESVQVLDVFGEGKGIFFQYSATYADGAKLGMYYVAGTGMTGFSIVSKDQSSVLVCTPPLKQP